MTTRAHHAVVDTETYLICRTILVDCIWGCLASPKFPCPISGLFDTGSYPEFRNRDPEPMRNGTIHYATRPSQNVYHGQPDLV